MTYQQKSDYLKSSVMRSLIYLIFLFVILSISMISLTSCSREESLFQAKEGVLDLRGVDFSTGKTKVNLEGEWELYRGSLICPGGTFGNNTENRELITVPLFWRHTTTEPLNARVATYRLLILVDPNQQDITLRIKDLRSSVNLFCNKKQVYWNGEADSTKAFEKPGQKTALIQLYPVGGKLELILHIFGKSNNFCGFVLAPSLGSFQKMNWIDKLASYRDFFLAGCIFCLAVFHIGYFFINRKKRARLYLGLFCLVLSFWTMISGDVNIYRLIPTIRWTTILHLRTIVISVLVALFPVYVSYIYPKQFFRPVKYIILAVSGLHIIYAFTFASFASGFAFPFFWIILLLVVAFLFYVYLSAMRAKEVDSVVLFIGGVIFLGFAVNDTLNGYGVIYTTNLMQLGLLCYLSFVSLILSLRDRRMINMVETQANSLWMINQELHMEIKKREQLNIELTRSHHENIASRLGTILGLAKLAEYRDMETGKHLERLQEYSGILTRELRKHEKYLNYITEAYIDDIHHSIILHDIGKVGVPDAILLKPGVLNPTEFSLIKLHPIIGAESIREIEREVKKKSFLNLGREIAYSHHEKWDGSGYPEGLTGEEIPLCARICALVDVYDALTTKRPYKEAYSHKKALGIISEGKGSHFDPDIVDAFLNIQEDFDSIRKSLQG